MLAKSRLERQRLLKWILAWCGLSATWFLGDDDPLAEINLAVAERAIATLERKLAVAAREIVAAAAQRDSGDFVHDVAMGLPLFALAVWVIWLMHRALLARRAA